MSVRTSFDPRYERVRSLTASEHATPRASKGEAGRTPAECVCLAREGRSAGILARLPLSGGPVVGPGSRLGSFSVVYLCAADATRLASCQPRLLTRGASWARGLSIVGDARDGDRMTLGRECDPSATITVRRPARGASERGT